MSAELQGNLSLCLAQAMKQTNDSQLMLNVKQLTWKISFLVEPLLALVASRRNRSK